jgi:single-strand DNA-binding protein
MNKAILIGRLTRDPESQTTSTGKMMTKFSLAVNDARNSKVVSYFDCVAFDREAEVVNSYVKKGMQVFIDGRISINNYTDRTGVERKGISVIVDNLKMLGSKSDNPRTSDFEDNGKIGINDSDEPIATSSKPSNNKVSSLGVTSQDTGTLE